MMSDQYQMQSKKFLRRFFIDRRNNYFEEYDKKNNAHTHLKLILENTKPCVVGSYLPFRNEFQKQLYYLQQDYTMGIKTLYLSLIHI